jgi:hypothetical protein
MSETALVVNSGEGLFVPQCVNGIHPRRPASGNVAGSQRCPQKDESRCREGQWIEWADVEKLVSQ